MKKENQYIWDAKDYAKHSSVQQDWAKELASKLSLNGYESVLDIGCGDGKITADIATQIHKGRVIGMDNSKDMIELASMNFPRETYPNLSFQIGDASHLPFKEEFDVVFSNAALHWIKDHKPIISGIKNSLKPNGRILLQMGGKGNAASILAILDTLLEEKEWNTYFAGFEFPYGFHDTADYKSWLHEAGLTPLRVELIPKDMSHRGKDGLAGWIRTTWLPYTDRIPVQQKNDFISQLVDRYIEKYPMDNDGHVHVGMKRLEVEAIKTTM